MIRLISPIASTALAVSAWIASTRPEMSSAYATGEVHIRLDDPQRFKDFGERVAGGDVDAARRMLAEYEAAFDAATSVLPAEPDTRTVADWLLRVRAAFL
jgi:hypothetical protein